MRNFLRLVGLLIVTSSCAGPSAKATRSEADPEPDPQDATTAPAPRAALPVDAASGAAAPAPDSGAPSDTGRSTDVSAATPGPDATAPPAATACKAKLCEGFEAIAVGATPGAPWGKAIRQGATMVVDATKPYTGARSLHVTIPAGGPSWGNVSQKLATAPVLASKSLFGRLMTFFSNQAGHDVPRGFTHFFVFDIRGHSDVAGDMDVNLSGWTGVRGFNYQTHLESGLHETGAIEGQWKAGVWECLQWQLDGTGKRARLWVNGKQVIDKPGWDMATPWQSFAVGYSALEPADKPVELWVDDFALDDAMIPCPS